MCYYPPQTIVAPQRVVYRDCYHPQLVRVVHPVEIITRHHPVPVYQHVYTYSQRDVNCGPQATLSEAGRTRRPNR